MSAEAVDASSSELLRPIFLDIDGVLHSADFPGSRGSTGQDLFLSDCLQRLKCIVTQAKAVIILSSSWRLEPESVAEVRRQLAHFEMAIYGSTCCESSLGCISRAEEIMQWLREHRECIESHVVLDDLDLTSSLGSSHCIVVDGSKGLSDHDVLTAIAMLTSSVAGVSVDKTMIAFEAAERRRPTWRERWEELEHERADRRKERKAKKKKHEKKSKTTKSNDSIRFDKLE